MSKMKNIPITSALFSCILLLSACGTSLETPEQIQDQNLSMNGRTFYVSPMGSDRNSGKSEQQPFDPLNYPDSQQNQPNSLFHPGHRLALYLTYSNRLLLQLDEHSRQKQIQSH